MITPYMQSFDLCDIAPWLNSFSPITLDETKKVRLMNRIDTKFVTTRDVLECMLGMASEHYYVQEIEGERNSAYHTVYLDTPDRAMYLAHQNGRRVREKIRVRTYLQSGHAFLEVKNKNNKGRTDKQRIAVTDVQTLCPHQADHFLRQHAWYCMDQLMPRLESRFRRVTLVNRRMTERLTIDTDLCFSNLDDGQTVQLPHIVIIELKRDGMLYSPIRQVLHQLRVHPTSISKYCIGSALTNPALKQNRLKSKIRLIQSLTNKRNNI